MKAILLVFLGGGLGSVCRYLANRWVVSMITSVFPAGTFLVNIVGCFLIGFLVFFTARTGADATAWRLLLVTGFCGGFTTFSSFSFENIQLMGDHQVLIFLLYLLLSIALGLGATYVGILVARNV
ncbi:fluoride efflux transporter CrcB [Pontibacter sp. 172403-2]|uniref:fluoride efflux transporter CrcB n=1 Tax=Pontibacter rufus TaxID=2791028 RepID=UPI0018B00B77|nr:fluoride efflux transporter CrcB [Pontibacter sp. 172403-2]MBF9252250.1 fluoride efflux transporter CrcB [Pontibacter sp. 172403-2]